MEAMRYRVLSDEEVPATLRMAARPCRQLYVNGTLPSESSPKVAIVGSRSPSVAGERTAYEIARALASAGVVVVSGLARGIDAAAHRGALDGGGITVAFLGCGIDVLYPRSSRRVAVRIPEKGAVVSEYDPGAAPLPYRFVERNRLVAAYTLGTLVVEAGAKSGALITAGLAVEAGRELWAVPGDPRRPGCRGNNRLLRDGAGAVLEAGDVLAALGLLGAHGGGLDGAGNPPPGLSAGGERIWRVLARGGPLPVESMSRESGLPVAVLLETLSLLELEGWVRRTREGYEISPGRRGTGAPPGNGNAGP